MSSFDQEATEVDIIELNELKQSVASCQRTIDQINQGVQVQAIPRPPVQLPRFGSPTQVEDEPMENRSSRSRPRPHVRGRSKSDKRRHPDSGDRRPSRRRKGEPIMVMPQVTIPPPTVAALFQGRDEELTSSCPTSQEPVVSVPSLFQTAGANLPLGGTPQVNPPPTIIAGQSGPPRDPRSQSERRRRVSIQTPPIRMKYHWDRFLHPLRGGSSLPDQLVQSRRLPQPIIQSCNHDKTHINKVDLLTMVDKRSGTSGQSKVDSTFSQMTEGEC